jgi:hypothetical protein
MSESLFAPPRDAVKLEDCLFYHTVDIPGHGTIPGFWDIRGNESQYLGDETFTGKRVLEIGPASGHITFFMESQKAEVVSIETSQDYAWEFFWDFCDSVPSGLQDMLKLNRENMERFRNSYWFCHRAHGSKARVHYGNGYNVPGELGKFDIAVLACVLLHTKSPLTILENCARVTQEKIIIVEPFRAGQLAQVPAEFLPRNNEEGWDTWWAFSPKFFVDVLRSMGFTYSRVTFHTQQCVGKPVHMFTVVASRNAIVDPISVGNINVAISSPVERLRLQPGRLTNLPLNFVNLAETPVSSFSSSPVLVSYHWKRKSGEIAVWDGLRTFLPRVLYKGDADDILLAVRAPLDPGDYVLEVSLLEEGRSWYDDRIDGLPLRIETVVTSG